MNSAALNKRVVVYLLTFIFIAVTEGFTQQSFKKGYIILVNGDTTSGYIQSQNSKLASKSCNFKMLASNEIVTKYQPGDIVGYRILDGKFFITKSVKKENEIKKVFMEYLIKGKANIFYFRDSKGDHFFIEKEGGELIELTEPPKIIQNSNGTGIYNAPLKYKGKLKSVMSDCADINPSIEKTQLNFTSLVNLAKEYHYKVCTTEDCIIYEKQEHVAIHYEIVAGYSINRYNFGSQLITNNGNSFQLGFQLDFKNFLLSNEKLGLAIGFLLEKDSKYTLSKFNKKDIYNERVTYYGAEYTINSNPDIFSVTSLDVDIDLLALKIPILINYYVDFKQVSLTVGGGLSNRFTLSQNRDFKYHDFSDQYGKSINTYLVGATANLGVKYKLDKARPQFIQLSILGDYSIDPRALNQFLRLKVSQLSFRIGYQF